MDKEKIMLEAVKYDKYVHDLDGAIEVLTKKKSNNENVYIDFNGKKLYSLLDDENSCYQKVLGCNKEQFLEERKRALEQWEKERQERKMKALARIPEWIRIGNELIYPQMSKEWERCVNIRAADLYNGRELDNALEIMKTLEKEEGNKGVLMAKKLLNDFDNSGASYGVTSSIVLTFSKRGPEFYREICKDLDFTKEEAERIVKVIKEKEEKNSMFEALLAEQKA